MRKRWNEKEHEQNMRKNERKKNVRYWHRLQQHQHHRTPWELWSWGQCEGAPCSKGISFTSSGEGSQVNKYTNGTFSIWLLARPCKWKLAIMLNVSPGWMIVQLLPLPSSMFSLYFFATFGSARHVLNYWQKSLTLNRDCEEPLRRTLKTNRRKRGGFITSYRHWWKIKHKHGHTNHALKCTVRSR